MAPPKRQPGSRVNAGTWGGTGASAADSLAPLRIIGNMENRLVLSTATSVV